MTKKPEGRVKRALKTLFGRSPSSPSPAPSSRSSRTRSYDGAQYGRAGDWVTGLGDPNAELLQGLEPLRQRSRDLVRNNAFARRIIDALTNAIVYTGLRPTVDVGDRMVKHPKTGEMVRLDDLVYELWEAWGKQPVSGSRITIYGLQQLLCRSWLTDGEALLRFRPRLPADMPGLPPLKLQPIEADHLPVTKNEQVPGTMNTIIQGVEFNALGEVVAFHLYRVHPGAQYPLTMASALETVRIPAESVVHLFRPTRPAQVRGEPILSPVILSLWDLAGYTDAIRVGTRAAATLVATVEGGDQESPPDGIANEDDESTGQLATDSFGNPIESLTPGMVIYAPNGKKVTIHAPQPPQGVKEFVAAMLHEIAAGVSMSYNVLAMDMSDSSFAQARLGLIEQAKNISVLREQTFCPVAMDPIWTAFVDACIAAGLTPNEPALYNVKWSAPKQQSADRLDEAKAAILEMQAGLRSREEIIESEGRDPDEVNAAIARDMEKREKLGIISLGDLSQVSLAGVAQNTVNTQPNPTDTPSDDDVAA